jgi:hypothetical protein
MLHIYFICELSQLCKMLESFRHGNVTQCNVVVLEWGIHTVNC